MTGFRLLGWHRIKQLRRTKTVSTMYVWLFVVPLAAKALRGVGGITNFNVFGNTFTLDFALPFTWQVFYFSAVCFTVGNLVYSVWCPLIVKDYDTASGFLADGKTTEQMFPYAEQLDWDLDKFNGEVNTINSQTKTTEKRYHRVFWRVHDAAVQHAPLALGVANAAYGAGLALGSYVLVENFLVVMRFIVSS